MYQATYVAYATKCEFWLCIEWNKITKIIDPYMHTQSRLVVCIYCVHAYNLHVFTAACCKLLVPAASYAKCLFKSNQFIVHIYIYIYNYRSLTGFFMLARFGLFIKTCFLHLDWLLASSNFTQMCRVLSKSIFKLQDIVSKSILKIKDWQVLINFKSILKIKVEDCLKSSRRQTIKIVSKRILS